MLSRIVSAALLIVVALPALGRDPKQVERDLSSEYKGKVMTLRHFPSGRTLRYNAAGDLLDGGPSGPWTVTGRVKVKKISLKQDKLEIQAERQLVVYNDKKRGFYEHSSWQKVKIEVATGINQTSADWKKAIDRVTVPADETWQSSLPTHWREFFETSKQGITLPVKPLGPGDKNEPDERGIYRVGKGVSFAKCVSCTQPEYEPAARSKKVSGVVILWVVLGADGRVDEVHVAKPIGAGLDEAAIRAVTLWQFQPARRGGQPVPVKMTIEISFNLY